MFNDTLSDVLTRIRNAGMVKHATVYVPLTRLSQQLCQILEKEGYINSFRRASVIQSANIRPPLIVVPKPPKRDKPKTSQDETANNDPSFDANESTDSKVTKTTAEVLTSLEVSSEAENVTVSEEAEAEEVVQSRPAFLVPPAVITPGSQPLLAVELKYIGATRKPCITNLRRISKPGLRIYSRSQDIPKVLDGMGILILSTSQGLMTDREARARRLGGEILCSVW